jgi:hypothetical protein
MNFTRTMMIAAATFAAPAAVAQTAAQQSAPAPAQTPAPTATAAATGAPVTDAEVSQFAAAALAVDKVRKDAAVPEADKNARYVEAITASGLSAARFNEISSLMQADTGLNARIQKAGAALQPAPAAQ